jgi:acetyl-CoA decarbonylase/synthase, CODH/ACS complex subunit delta
MALLTAKFDWEGHIGGVMLGATPSDGGTRAVAYRVGGDRDLPFIGEEDPGSAPLVAYEICDDPSLWSPIITRSVGQPVHDPKQWAGLAEKEYGADLVRLYLTSTRRRAFTDFSGVTRSVEEVLGGTRLPVIIEGSDDPVIDSEVFQRCGEAGEGERLLLGTAEAGRYRSVAAAAMAYNHAVIAQSPIDINLAKQLNILLREIGVPGDHIMIDPYTGALGYGFEYSYSVMERIRFAALKGDQDLAMPMISAAIDSLNIKEVRDSPADLQDEMAVMWEFYAGFSAAIAGAAIICVRHPRTVPLLKEAFRALAPDKEGGV